MDKHVHIDAFCIEGQGNIGTWLQTVPFAHDGIAVNFGTTNFGKGKVQPKAPVKSEPRQVEELPQPAEPSKVEPTKANHSNYYSLACSLWKLGNDSILRVENVLL